MPDANVRGPCHVGVDLGGTKIYAGVFDSRLSLIGSSKYSTKPQRGVEAVLDRIARCVRDAVDECDLPMSQVKGVGIGAPGVVDTDSGRVVMAPNLEWKDVPLQRELARRLEVPVAVDNDCNLATLGVHRQEMGGKPRSLVGIFIGTGVGGGIVQGGELVTGASRAAGELGHMVLQADGPRCSCGSQGCLEALASRTAIFRRISGAVREGQKTLLTEMLGEDLKDMRSGDLRRAIRRGDKLVEAIIREAAEYVGLAVASLANILNPEFVVLGGGVIEALEGEMMPVITKTARDHMMPGVARGTQIAASTLGDHAGLIGAALVAMGAGRG